MVATVDAMVKVLEEAGVDFLPYDEELSFPEEPAGSIEWLEFYVENNIGEDTGFSPAMYTSASEDGLCITSVRNSKFIPFSPDAPEEFVTAVKATMEKFYNDL